MSITIAILVSKLDDMLEENEVVTLGNHIQLCDFHLVITREARELMARKNVDYAGGTPSIFGNLDSCEALGLCTTEQGILIRMLDKQTRVANVLKAGQSASNDETIIDNLIDIINYSVLLAAKMAHRQLQTMKEPTNDTH